MTEANVIIVVIAAIVLWLIIDYKKD